MKMAHSDPLFRLEIVLEELKSYVNKRQFIIKSQFADVFSLVLRDPLEQEQSLIKIKKPRSKLRGKGNIMAEVPPKVLSGQSVLFTSNIDELISYMMQYPMEISFWNKKEPDSMIGSTVIPWNPAFVEFLARLYKAEDPPPVVVNDTRNVFDELTSKRMATIKLVIKMSHIPETAPLQYKYNLRVEKKPSSLVYSCISKKSNTLNTEKKPLNTRNETGVIKTFYSGGKRKQKYHSRTKKRTEQEDLSIGIEHSDLKEIEKNDFIEIEHSDVIETEHSYVKEIKSDITMGKSLLPFIRSDTDIDRNIPMSVTQIKSCTSIKPPQNLNYIFNDRAGRFGNKVYTVGYLTVESIPSKSSKGKESKGSSSASKTDKSSKTSSKESKTKPDASSKGSKTKPDASSKGSKTTKPEASSKGSKPDAAGKGSKAKPDTSKSKSVSTTSSKKDFSFRLCAADCPAQKKTPYAKSECTLDLPEAARELITVTKCKDLRCFYRKERPPTNVRNQETKLELPKPCCVTTVKEQVVGSMKAQMMVGDVPCSCACECLFFGKKTTYCHVCGGYEAVGDDTAGRPHYQMPPPCPIYHRIEKKKPSTRSNSGSESNKKRERGKKGKKRKIDSRFKFNYGYKGIPPQIGHSQCAMPCSGHLNNVPKRMGWLWTADNVPGLPFRPQYKPGAVNKFVVRLLKQARNPGEVAKKRRKDTGKRKRPLKRPLLIVHKKDGEYSVTMETMKPYAKQRATNQPPYEDKDPIMYTIGRTEEENRERRKKKERAQRRLEREQRDFIQSAFKDMCKDICIKTYQQAMGILPDTELPECVCYPALPGPEHTNLNRSCSCSEDSASLASDTDSDEWIVEFTPPSAHFDPTFKVKKVQKIDAETQYTYLDYRVKLLDFSGNQVPRYFKGLDGKELCSDLGGFWGPDHQWMTINVDGFIAPDGRWAPNIFTGPNGEQVDAEPGKFQAMNGDWLTVGVDGYVDSQNKWRFYPRRKPTKKTTKIGQSYSAKKGGGEDPKSNQSWSCFGDVSPAELSKMGITGHGIDRKMLHMALKELVASGRNDVKLPDLVRDRPGKSSKKGRRTPNRTTFEVRCRHAPPSDKGIVIDKTGHKRYFRAHNWRNLRPRERIVRLERQGRSLSSFHRPCFHSFISHESMMAQQRERLIRMAAGQASPAPNEGKSIAVQTMRRM